MKKLILGLIGIAMAGAAHATDVTIYYSPTCPHCHHARQFINETLIFEYPDIVVTQVNVMDQQNLEKFRNALQTCKYESGGVPVMVIDGECFQGYADFMQQELRDAVEKGMSESAISAAHENRAALEANPEQYRNDHADRAGAIVEYDANAAHAAATSKSNGGGTAVFWVVLVALVAALGFVLVRKKK